MKGVVMLGVLLVVAVTVATQGQVPATPTQEAPQTPAGEAMTLRVEPGLRVANAYGVAAWEQVEEIGFTFNVQRAGGAEPMSRRWTWQPQAGEVTLTKSDGEAVRLLLVPGRQALRVGSDLDEDHVAAHRAFINDSYWLLFPFQLVWSRPEITEQGEQPLPLGDDAAEKLTVQYPRQGGYTPGDAYDLYLGEEGRIVQWVYRKGGIAAEQGRPATWEGHVRLGPITVATEHKNGDGSFRLWFSDLNIVVRDAEGQVAAHGPEPIEE